MSEASLMLEAFKRTLKAKGVTYKELAKKLSLSEASVKRLFSEESFSLKRFEEAAAAVNISLSEIMKSIDSHLTELPRVLTEDQEQLLADNEKLFSLFYLLLNGATIAHLKKNFKGSLIEVEKLLLLLDKSSLIELHSEKKYKFLTSPNLIWRANGPLRRKFEGQVKEEFMDGDFSSPNSMLKFVNGRIAKSSLEHFSRQVEKLLRSYEQLVEVGGQDVDNISFLVAFRPFEFSLCRKYLK